MSWESKQFKDVVQFPPKITLEKDISYSFIPMEDLTSGVKYVKPSQEKEWKGSGGAKFEEGDTLFARITPCLQNGKISQAKNLINGKGFGSTEYFIFRGLEGVTDTDFVYYLVLNEEFKQNAIGSMVGASGRQRADAKFVGEYEIDLPPLQTQKRIASILSAYDDLIENNLKRIKILEEMAQNIYKEWFVNFRFPNYENTEFDKETGLPVGWGVNTADDIYNINIGKTPPRGETQWFSTEEGIKWVSIADINKSSVFVSQTNERITREGVQKFNMKMANEDSVLLSFKLTVGAVVIASEEVVTNEAIAHFNLLEDSILSTEYTYCFLKNFNYQSLGSTSSIGTSINSKIVKKMQIIVPAENIISEFTTSVHGAFKQIKNLTFQNQKLKEARDILLPRLMNRTIEV